VAEDVDREAKTEDPTPRRREEARRQGRVPFSAELVGSLVTLAGVLGLVYFGSELWGVMLNVFRHDLPRAFRPDLDAAAAADLFARAAARLLSALLPMFGAVIAVAVAASVAQVGFQINTEKLAPDFDKLNPANGVSRLFSVAALVRGGLTLLKVAALGVVAYLVLRGRGGVVLALHRDRLAGAAPAVWAVVMRLAQYLAGAVALIAVLDYLYQRYQFEQALRMTKEEVKRELKEEDGDPQIKARIRQLARERSRRKMLSAVPTATVVVTNPTHYAVALRYRRSGVTVLERPPLARALYGVKEGQPIPAALFRAVAEVLAFVYRLRGLGPT
jgi:flagellar biosynthetic protein FlhB